MTSQHQDDEALIASFLHLAEAEDAAEIERLEALGAAYLRDQHKEEAKTTHIQLRIVAGGLLLLAAAHRVRQLELGEAAAAYRSSSSEQESHPSPSRRLRLTLPLSNSDTATATAIELSLHQSDRSQRLTLTLLDPERRLRSATLRCQKQQESIAIRSTTNHFTLQPDPEQPIELHYDEHNGKKRKITIQIR